MAERFGEQLRKTSVHKKCVYQQRGGNAPCEKCEVLPGERRRNSLISELDVLILVEEKMVKSFETLGEKGQDAEPGLILRGPSELSQIPRSALW